MIKPGVDIRGLQPQMVLAYVMAQPIYDKYGYPCVITSGVDSKHGINSLHPKGLALDLRTNHIKDTMVTSMVCQEIKEALGPQFDVVFEPDEWEDGKQVKWQHIHVEFDPK